MEQQKGGPIYHGDGTVSLNYHRDPELDKIREKLMDNLITVYKNYRDDKFDYMMWRIFHNGRK